jgi:hypothetical protein
VFNPPMLDRLLELSIFEAMGDLARLDELENTAESRCGSCAWPRDDASWGTGLYRQRLCCAVRLSLSVICASPSLLNQKWKRTREQGQKM